MFVLNKMLPLSYGLGPALHIAPWMHVMIGLWALAQFANASIYCLKRERFRAAARSQIAPSAFREIVHSWSANVDLVLDGQRWRGRGATVEMCTFVLEDKSEDYLYEASVLCRTPEGAWFRIRGTFGKSMRWRPRNSGAPIQPLQIIEAKNVVAALGLGEYGRIFGEPPLAGRSFH